MKQASISFSIALMNPGWASVFMLAQAASLAIQAAVSHSPIATGNAISTGICSSPLCVTVSLDSIALSESID